MATVRPFRHGDAVQVAEIHRQVFATAPSPSFAIQAAYQRYFQTVFLESPFSDSALPSLVFEEAGGKIAGFLGVTSRRFLFRDRPILAAIGSQFIVDPARRSTLAGVQLLKAFLSGPQDLSLADEASDESRKIWQAFGGQASIPFSIYWRKVFRPSEFFAWRVSRSGGATTRHPFARWAGWAAPFCHAADAIGNSWRGTRANLPPELSIEQPAVEELAACIGDLTPDAPLRPEYDSSSLGWLLRLLERHTEEGFVRRGIVRAERSKIVGWYVYQAMPGGLGEVLQIGATPNRGADVLRCLFFDAMQRRVAALTGRLQLPFMDELRKQRCALYNRSLWTLIHSRNSDIMQAVRSGDAFLSRLEGEYCTHFGGQAAFASPDQPNELPDAPASETQGVQGQTLSDLVS